MTAYYTGSPARYCDTWVAAGRCEICGGQAAYGVSVDPNALTWSALRRGQAGPDLPHVLATMRRMCRDCHPAGRPRIDEGNLLSHHAAALAQQRWLATRTCVTCGAPATTGRARPGDPTFGAMRQGMSASRVDQVLAAAAPYCVPCLVRETGDEGRRSQSVPVAGRAGDAPRIRRATLAKYPPDQVAAALETARSGSELLAALGVGKGGSMQKTIRGLVSYYQGSIEGFPSARFDL